MTINEIMDKVFQLTPETESYYDKMVATWKRLGPISLTEIG